MNPLYIYFFEPKLKLRSIIKHQTTKHQNNKMESGSGGIDLYLNPPYINKQHIVTINDQPHLMFNEFHYDFVIHGKKYIFTPCINNMTVKRIDDKYSSTTMKVVAKDKVLYNISIDMDHNIKINTK